MATSALAYRATHTIFPESLEQLAFSFDLSDWNWQQQNATFSVPLDLRLVMADWLVNQKELDSSWLKINKNEGLCFMLR